MQASARTLFVTATGTDVGKTYVSALIVAAMRKAGLDAGYYKAAASGCTPADEGTIRSDAAFVAARAGLDEPHGKLVSFSYHTAVSPHLAARIEGNPVDLAVIRRDFRQACCRHDFVLVEGSGGIVCPLRFDEHECIMLEDVIASLGLETIIVADAGLGALNGLATTACYLAHKNIACHGIILNRFIPGDALHEDNRLMAEYLTRLPVVACATVDAQTLDRSIFEVAALFT